MRLPPSRTRAAASRRMDRTLGSLPSGTDGRSRRLFLGAGEWGSGGMGEREPISLLPLPHFPTPPLSIEGLAFLGKFFQERRRFPVSAMLLLEFADPIEDLFQPNRIGVPHRTAEVGGKTI